MASHSGETPSDDFLEQILGFPSYAGGADCNLGGNDAAGLVAASPAAMMLQLGSGDGSAHLGGVGMGAGIGGAFAAMGHSGGGFPLGLSLEHGNGGFMKMDVDGLGSGKRFGDDDVVNARSSSFVKGFHGQQTINTNPGAAHQSAIRPRVRARRGQATDPHSIAERLRREKITERVRALQELVPTVNKTDRAAMLDDVVDYVKFLRLQVKVLSMSRLGGATAVAPLMTGIPISTSSAEEEGTESVISQEPAWERWSNDGTERQVAKLMEENVGAAMQFLQSKALCIMPISLASVIYHSQSPEAAALTNPESN